MIGPDYTINAELGHWHDDAPKVVTVNQIGIAILAQSEN